MSNINPIDKVPSGRVPKKRGPVKQMDMVNTHVHLPAELVEWAKHQPERLSPMVRRLLTEERRKQQSNTGENIINQ